MIIPTVYDLYIIFPYTLKAYKQTFLSFCYSTPSVEVLIFLSLFAMIWRSNFYKLYIQYIYIYISILSTRRITFLSIYILQTCLIVQNTPRKVEQILEGKIAGSIRYNT